MDNLKEAIKLIDEAVAFSHIQDYSEESAAFRQIMDILLKMPEIVTQIADPSSEVGLVISGMNNALNCKDMILLSDYLESGLKPYLISRLEYPEPISTANYIVEPTETGLFTAMHIKTGMYLHSNVNPVSEAKALVNFVAKEGATEYAVFGLGLGYHVEALSDYYLDALEITVFEEDDEIIELCKKNGAKSIFARDNIRIIHDPSCESFSRHISEKSSILMHYPSVCKISSSTNCEAMKRFFLGWNTTVQKRRELSVNFTKNLSLNAPNVCTLKSEFEGKEVVYVGGGPSLVRSIEFIKKNREKLLVTCASTSLRKLCDLGVVPDYSFVLDPSARTYGHMQGIEGIEVPIIFAATSFWRFGANAAGKRYIAYQSQYEPSIQAAAREGVMTFETGGSVTTIAISIAVSLGAKRLYLAGVDMGFPGGKTHAEGTLDAKTVSNEGLIPVEAVNGETIYTDEKLYSYLKWIEQKIANSPKTEFVNLSDCGALIRGAKRGNIF